jgi:hypothetical protein
MWARLDLNQRPADYESAALTRLSYGPNAASEGTAPPEGPGTGTSLPGCPACLRHAEVSILATAIRRTRQGNHPPLAAKESYLKYVLLLIRSDDAWEALTDEERNYEGIMRWWAEHAAAGRVVGGHELQAARSATTVGWERGRPLVTDGPFIEAKETIGGYGVLEVPDLDAAIEVAKSWPAPGHRVEIRPVKEH